MFHLMSRHRITEPGKAPMVSHVIDTVDFHTAGEPFRIVESVPIPLRGDTVAQRRAFAQQSSEAEDLRRFLCHEPRGHADMYGAFVVPPDDDGAHFGVVFWHKDGYSTACGHGTIALGRWAVESGRVPSDPSGITEVVIDVPSGRVVARVHGEGQRVDAVDFVNVPSWHVVTTAVTTRHGEFAVHLGYGGAFYAQIDVASTGCAIAGEDLPRLIDIAREVRDDLDARGLSRHHDPLLSGVYGTIFFERFSADSAQIHERNVTVFADGEVDRSPCGSGTAARVATLHALSDFPGTRILKNDSISGGTFLAHVDHVFDDGAVVPVVRGSAYPTGRHSFVKDERDSLLPGFLLR